MSIGAVTTRPATSANDQPAPIKSAPPTAVAIPAELQDPFTFTIDLNSPYLDYLLGQSLLNKPETERQAIAAALIARTGLQGVDLVLPPGKLYLAPAKDTAMDKLLFRQEQKPWDLQELIVLCYSAIMKAVGGKAGVPADKLTPLPMFGWYVQPLSPTTRDIPLTVLETDKETNSVKVLIGQGAEAVRFILPAENSDLEEAKTLYLIFKEKRRECGFPAIKQVNMTEPGLNPIVRFALDEAGCSTSSLIIVPVRSC
ncbi:MAG: hypothetical protein WC529_05785 [Candidatus Margulisiibacteriota bacterium]